MRRHLVSPRLRFRSADPGAATAGSAPATPAADATGTGNDAATPAGAEGAPAGDHQEQQPAAGETLPDDPEALKAEIARLRRENAASRTNAKATAADEARTALVQELGRALGLVKDGEAPPKPEELTAQVQAAQAAQRATAVELAVFRTATQHGADPAALTDSRAFLAKVTDLDPAAADFQAKVVEAAKAAATDNPKLKAAPVATSSSVDHAGGTGEGAKKPTSIEGAATAHYAGRSA